MLTKIFESLDEKVFTPELKQALWAQFNEAVEARASEIAQVRIDEEVDSLNVKSEEHIEFLNEQAEEYVSMKQTEMVDSLDKYLDRIVEEFVADKEVAMNESIAAAKSAMLIEAFESLVVASGVKVAQIMDEKEKTEAETQLNESIKKYDTLVEENISLKEENDRLIKLGVINELKEGLSIVECEKFEKLAELVEFSRDKSFVDKLDVIKKNVSGLNESKKEVIEDEEAKPVWAHLI